MSTIDYLGPRDVATAIDIMGHASFVIVPTVGIETFGRVVAEAQARGTPSIVSDLGALSEIVDDGVTGRRVPAGDTAALAAAVRDMWSRPNGADSMRAAARASFLDHFSSDVALTRWESFYAEVIKASGG
jgi:glycosyltransferase involved in cell wall biosynthesis